MFSSLFTVDTFSLQRDEDSSFSRNIVFVFKSERVHEPKRRGKGFVIVPRTGPRKKRIKPVKREMRKSEETKYISMIDEVICWSTGLDVESVVNGC